MSPDFEEFFFFNLNMKSGCKVGVDAQTFRFGRF